MGTGQPWATTSSWSRPDYPARGWDLRATARYGHRVQDRHREELPDAVAVIDTFPRRSGSSRSSTVTAATCTIRSYRAHRILHAGADLLTDKQQQRL